MLPFHLLAYSVTGGAALTDGDVTAPADQSFSRRNGHFIFSEPYNLIAAWALGATITRARLNVPTINAVARHQIWPVEVGTVVPARVYVQDMRTYPMPLPMNEEIAIEATNAAAEQATAIMTIAPPGWNMNLPRGLQRLTVRATGAVTLTAFTWSALGAITFAENLRGGWFSVVGMQCFCAGMLAIRLVFPRMEAYNGRILRPGVLGQNAIANAPADWQMGGLGEFGRFHSFEPPQIECFGNAAGAAVQEIRLDLVYLGNSMAV